MKRKRIDYFSVGMRAVLSATMFFSLGVTAVADDERDPSATEAPAEVTEVVDASSPEPAPAPEETVEAETPAAEETTAPVEETAVSEETVTPEATAEPAPTPEATVEPQTPAPEETAAAAEETAAPEETAVPEETAEPEATPEATPEEETETVTYMAAKSETRYTGQMAVTVSWDDHTFPEGTTLEVTDVSRSDAIAAAEQSTEGDEEVIDAVAVDITFYNAAGEEIQPERPVSVSMVPYTPLETTETSTTEVIHKDDSGNTQVIDADASAQNATFDADSFSIYVISSKDCPHVTKYIFEGATGDNAEQTVKKDDLVYAPASPEKTGYIFMGWSYDDDNKVDPDKNDPGIFTTMSANVAGDKDQEIHLYPVFQEALYVFFMDNHTDENGKPQPRISTTIQGTIKEDGTYESINVSDVTIPLDSTHSVIGWYTDPELNNQVTSVTLENENIYLYPKVEEGHYMYFSTGEDATYIKPVFVPSNEIASEPSAPTRPGYTFKGWVIHDQEDQRLPFDSTIDQEYHFDARWEADDNTSYTVIFWKQSINDDKNLQQDQKTYDYDASAVRSAKSGTEVSPTDEDKSKTWNGFHFSHADESVTVNGNGTSIVNVYYDRDLLKINFDYGRTGNYQYVEATGDADQGTQYYGLVNGEYIEIQYSRRHRGWGYYTVWGLNLTWTSYTGTRYIRTPEHRIVTFDGLYGQPLSKYNYQWPKDYKWRESDGSQLTFLDAFIFDGQDTEDDGATLNLTATDEKTGSYHINHYKQDIKAESSYSLADSTREDGSGGSFTFTNKYTGFTVAQYSLDGENWNPASANTTVNYYRNLYIRYTRNEYNLSFNNYGSVDQPFKVKYGGSLSGYSSYIPKRPSTLPEAYNFGGWYKDKECTVKFDFKTEMPANNVQVYAKWTAEKQPVTVHTSLEGEGTVSFEVPYRGTIEPSQLPTVKDIDGNIVFEGKSDQEITLPANVKWAGWAEKDGTSFKLWNFNTQVESTVELYPYYISTEKFQVHYTTAEGTGTAPKDDHYYARGSFANVLEGKNLKDETNGKVFLYWTREGSNIAILPGDKIKMDSDVTLTAVFGNREDKTTLRYHLNDGTSDLDGEEITNILNNSDLTAKEGCTRNGYTFINWNTKADGTGTTVNAKETFRIDKIGSNDLYAQWQTKLEISISGTEKTVTYNGQDQTNKEYEYTVKVGGKDAEKLPDRITLNYSGDGARGKDAAETPYTATLTEDQFSVSGNDNNRYNVSISIKQEIISLKVTPKPVTVTADSKSKTYGAPDPELTATVSGTLGDDKVSYTLSREKGEKVGTYKITPTGDASQGNYTVSYETGTLTINKAGTLNLTASGYEGEYDGKPHAASASAGVMEGTTIFYQVGDDGQWTTEAPRIKDVGEKKVNVKAENANYETATATVTLKVKPKAVTVTAENISKTYGADDPELTANVEGTVDDDTVAYMVSRVAGEAVGYYAINPTGEASQGNYTVTYVPGTLTITAQSIEDTTLFEISDPDDVTYQGVELKQPVTVTRIEKQKKNSVLSRIFSFINVNAADTILEEGRDYKLEYSEVFSDPDDKSRNLIDVGTVTITVTGIGNYSGTVERTYLIRPALLTVITYSAEKDYDGKPLTAGGRLEGIVDPEVKLVTFSTTGSQTDPGSSVNRYEIHWGDDVKSSNYSITEQLGTLKVHHRKEKTSNPTSSAPAPKPASTNLIPRTSAEGPVEEAE